MNPIDLVNEINETLDAGTCTGYSELPTKIKKVKNSIRLVSQNLRSLYKNHDKLQHYINCEKEDVANFIFCQETWQKPNTIYTLPGFKTLSRPRSDKNSTYRKGGGICLFYDETLVVSEIESFEQKDIIEMQAYKYAKSIFVNFYRPPQANGKVFLIKTRRSNKNF